MHFENVREQMKTLLNLQKTKFPSLPFKDVTELSNLIVNFLTSNLRQFYSVNEHPIVSALASKVKTQLRHLFENRRKLKFVRKSNGHN